MLRFLSADHNPVAVDSGSFRAASHADKAQLFELECFGADYDWGAFRSAGFDIARELPEPLVPFN